MLATASSLRRASSCSSARDPDLERGRPASPAPIEEETSVRANGTGAGSRGCPCPYPAHSRGGALDDGRSCDSW